MSSALKKTPLILAALLLTLAVRGWAQLKPGEASLNLNATISAGYSDDYSNLAGSDHSIGGAGSGDLSGFYYNPNFLSFDVQPFYNQSRLNSNFQSITSSSGVNASAKLFSGTDYPGSVSYTTTYNGSGNFGIPGLANYTTHGNSDVFAVTWGANPDDLPSLNLSFSNANSTYSVYGANTQGWLHSDTFSATSAYQIGGFKLNGGYEYAGNSTVTPEFLAGELPQQSDSGASSFFFGVGHNLPWHGSFTATATRLDITTNFGDTTSADNYNSTIDTLSAGFFLAPLSHLDVGANTYYTDNLEGTLYNTLLTAGVNVPESELQQSSHDLSLTSYANYEMPAQHLILHGFVEREQQTFLGISFASDAYNGTATYSNTLLGGAFNGVFGITRTSLDTTHQALLGLNASANYTHLIGRWTVAGAFGYSQDAQTILIAYTTSGYNYSGSIGRRIRGRSYWGANAGGARSLLTDEPGSVNSSQSYSTSLTVPHFSVNGSYSVSRGNALLTSTGLVTTPVPVTALNPAAVVLFNGKSYSVGLGANPIRKLTFSAIYSKALSTTDITSTNSNNRTDNLNFLMVYNFRKLSFQSGYLRLVQGFSASGTPPALLGSFYVGVSRWFNFF
jgi:hypothetical protein